MILSPSSGIPSLHIFRVSGGEEDIAAVGSPLLELRAWSPLSPGTSLDGPECIGVETSARQEDKGVFRIEHLLRAKRTAFLSRCLASFRPVSLPAGDGFRFVPHLHPKPNMVAPDQVFRSPCAILEGGPFTLSLVPDLEALAGLNEAGMRTAITLDGDTISYGILRHKVKGHVYFTYRPLPGFCMRVGQEVALAYYIFISAEGGPEMHRRINSFLWERYGRRRAAAAGPQELPLPGLAQLAGEWAFLDEENWTEFEVGGKACGGSYNYNMNSRLPPLRRDRLTNTAFIALPHLYAWILRFGASHITNRPLLYRLLRKSLGSSPGASPSVILLQSWFNNVRSAYGAAWLARETGDGELARRAALTREFALASPRPHGFFPAVLYLVGDRMVWRKGTRGFTILNRYHLADSCTTGYHLLEWHRDLDEEPAALEACRRQADEVMKLQAPSGAFPAWFGFKRGKAVTDPCLAESAESASAVMFLALLARITGREDYLRSARAGGDFLVKEVVTPNIWYDYETFFSCSPKPVDWRDPRSGCRPENTMCIYWTAAALLQLYLACGEEQYLEAGRRTLDRLFAYHQVWDPPFLSINGFGGFASQNTDAEWNDARQGLIAPLLIDYYHATGEAEYFERGAATLRACFTTIHLGREPFALLRPSVRGSIAENYAHFGYDVPAPGYLMVDWGAGSSLYAAARILSRHGQVYVDLPRGQAFGIDGCTVREFRRVSDTLHIGIDSTLEGARDLVFRFSLPDDRPLRLFVNGREMRKYAADELARGITVPAEVITARP